MKNKKLKVAAVGDLHVTDSSEGRYKKLFKEISQNADILLVCGDLTGNGEPLEAEIFCKELKSCSIPVLGILGNHDYDRNKEEDIKKIIKTKSEMKLLEKDSFEINGVGFAGTKGFCGGFGSNMIVPFGEKLLKDFAKEAVNESLHLEYSLSRLKAEKKVVALHYSPIKETLKGEDPEKFAVLGSSHLEEPINNFNACIVFHGHVHHGSIEGKTSKNIPVYNVALPLMEEINPSQPFMLLEI